jgi:hypothetical protein
MKPLFTFRSLIVCALGAALLGPALARPQATQVDWHAGTEPAVRFNVGSSVGVYAQQADSVQITLYAAKLPTHVLNYAARRQAAVLNGTVARFRWQPLLDEQIDEAAKQSISLWAKLANARLDPSAPRGKELSADALRSMNVCVSRNCSVYSGALGGADFAAQVKALRFPTMMPPTAQALSAELDVAIQKSATGEARKALQFSGTVPFVIVNN